MSRRRIQQLRDAGARRHGDDVRVSRATHDDDDDDDDDGGGGGGGRRRRRRRRGDGGDVPTNNTALRMSLRHIRSLDDVTDCYRLALKVGLVWLHCKRRNRTSRWGINVVEICYSSLGGAVVKSAMSCK